MRVVVKSPNKHWFEADVPNNLEVFQSLVGGPIEILELDNDVDMIVNKEGILRGLGHNMELIEDFLLPVDIYGTAVFVSISPLNEEDFSSLSIEQMSEVIELIERSEV